MSEPTQYETQHRGDAAAYQAYFAGMDRTMHQKLAFVGAHFLLDAGSRVADMGCGSGSGTYQLALLNPQIQVIGVDINPESVRFAADKFKLPNLTFRVGDAAEPLFADDPLDGILSSSTLHHVYTFNGYSHEAVRHALANHLRCLRPDGVFVLRDFVIPSHEGYVLLELPGEPSRGETPQELSDADLLLRFARTARPLDKRCGPGFFLEEIEPRRHDTRRFRLPHKWAAEFVLRKDYRTDWDVELLEEYSYFTADEFVREIAGAGGRVICAEPYWNSWIVGHRFEGKFQLTDENECDLGWPATNFVAVAQRTRPGASTRLIERRPADQEPSFLVLETMRDTSGPGAPTYDLVRRPHPVCDVIPWRIADGRLRVAARAGYPRPITRAVPRGPSMIDGSYWGGYLIEPVTGMMPRGAPAADAAATLLERVGIAPVAIKATDPALSYYPSPGGIDEIVNALFVEIAEPLIGRAVPAAVSGFSASGQLREFDAQDLLRAAHVGVLPEARLEINIYALLDRVGLRPDPYIGDPIELSPALPTGMVRSAALGELLARPAAAPFEPVDRRNGYLRLIRSVFADQTDADGEPRTLAEQELEFVVPRDHSINTIVALPVAHDGQPLVGLETRMLPVPQLREGDARILAAPAWRLPRSITTLAQAKAFVAAKTNAAIRDVLPLGAAYFPSAGITPERVHPFVVRVGQDVDRSGYDFVPLRHLRGELARLRDAHLLVAAMRLMHALGLWETSDA